VFLLTKPRNLFLCVSVGWSLNAQQKLNSKKYHGNRGGCVPFRLNLSCVKKLQARRTFRGCTWAIKILTNRHFCRYLGPSLYRVLAAQRQGIVGVTPLIVAHWVVYFFYCQERHTYALSKSTELQLIFIMRYTPIVFMNKCHRTLCSVICDLDSAVSFVTFVTWIFVKCCNHSSLHVIWHLLVKKAKATNPSERYQSWPDNLFSAIVPYRQLFTPLNKGV